MRILWLARGECPSYLKTNEKTSRIGFGKRANACLPYPMRILWLAPTQRVRLTQDPIALSDARANACVRVWRMKRSAIQNTYLVVSRDAQHQTDRKSERRSICVWRAK